MKPLVSVFMFVRNGAPSVRRALDSMMAQTYPNMEFVIQDAVSTDGTLDILRGYGERLKIVSEPDSGPSDGLLRAMRRCSGEFIASCLADEELLPDAVERAVDIFAREPGSGAVTGDAIITDLGGKQTGLWTSGPFNLVDYLTADYTPYYCASLFRRETLLAAGLQRDDWTMECVEFETWCRLAAHGAITYAPGIIAKYASHPDQSSNRPADVVKHMRGRLKLIAGMCSSDGLLGDAPLLHTLFLWGHARRFCEHALQIGRADLATDLHALIRDRLASLPPVELDGVRYDENFGRAAPAKQSWLAQMRGRPAAPEPLLRIPAAPDKQLKGRMYALLAERYAALGRPAEALRVWRDVAVLNGLLPGPDYPPVGYTQVTEGS
ncbi:MAG TPA: glycosyltransferase [Reyranella sp.]|nr:glycosyltransferase [Reyranella sp.]